jgi:uncharacterized protein YcnI
MLKITAAIALILPVAAAGHVVLAPESSPVGAYYVGDLRVGHGCDGAATTELQVAIPAGVKDAKPQPKPGWTIAIDREGGRVTALRWTGSLPADEFDNFGIMLVLDPSASGPLYLPVIQRCGTTEKRWTQIPAAGAAWTSVPAPAPVLNVSPAHRMDHSGH